MFRLLGHAYGYVLLGIDSELDLLSLTHHPILLKYVLRTMYTSHFASQGPLYQERLQRRIVNFLFRAYDGPSSRTERRSAAINVTLREGRKGTRKKRHLCLFLEMRHFLLRTLSLSTPARRPPRQDLLRTRPRNTCNTRTPHLEISPPSVSVPFHPSICKPCSPGETAKILVVAPRPAVCCTVYLGVPGSTLQAHWSSSTPQRGPASQ